MTKIVSIEYNPHRIQLTSSFPEQMRSENEAQIKIDYSPHRIQTTSDVPEQRIFIGGVE
jgi:hypothetical protein